MGTQTCAAGECVNICQGGAASCGEGCCLPGQICANDVCLNPCGFGACNPETEACCPGGICCPLMTFVCGGFGSCALAAECLEGETLIPAFNYCCPDTLYCPTELGEECCNAILGERCLLGPEGYSCEQYDGGPTPGEVSRTVAMLVTDYDKLTGSVTVSYDPACETTDNAVYHGLLASLPEGYEYAGQICEVGNTGAATFDVPEGSFFVVVGRNETFEGSHGTMLVAGSPSERSTATMCAECPLQRNLLDRCD